MQFHLNERYSNTNVRRSKIVLASFEFSKCHRQQPNLKAKPLTKLKAATTNQRIAYCVCIVQATVRQQATVDCSIH